MGRKEILATLFVGLIGLGGAGLIGSTVPDVAYKPILIWGGLSAIVVGLIGIAALFAWSKEMAAPEAAVPPDIGGINTTNQSGGKNTQNISIGDRNGG